MTTLTAGVVAGVRPDVGGRLGQVTVDGRRLFRDDDESEGKGWAFWGIPCCRGRTGCPPSGSCSTGGRTRCR